MTVIGSNISALKAANASNSASSMLSTSMERLSTGKRINSAKDDAAGLAIASRMTSAVKSMAVAVRNANDGISLAQTAEGALGEVTNMLQRMKELATQSASGTLQNSDRTALQAELKQLTAEIGNVSSTTKFNGVALLDGSNPTIQLQTGINGSDKISMSMVSIKTDSLGLTTRGGVVASGTQVDLSKLTSNANVQINNQSVDAKMSAKDVAKLVTGSGVTGTAGATTLTATYATPGADTIVNVGGVDVTLTAADDTAAKAAVTINAALVKSGVDTGIVASGTGTTLTLNAANGENISLKTGSADVLTAAKDNNGAAFTGSLADGVASKAKVTLTSAGSTDISVDGSAVVETALGVSRTGDKALDISSPTSATNAMAAIDSALDKISAARGDLGAVQNRLQSTVNNLTTSSTNLADAKSRIEDTDFSAETTALAKAQILSQASTAMLSQANQSQQSVLKLLQ